MQLTRKETLKYVIHETMGDDTVYIKVKFVYNTYVFDKLYKSEEVIEPIIFQTDDEAENYAKYALSPCVEMDNDMKRGIFPCLNELRDSYDYKDISIYRLNTDYNEPLEKMLMQYNEICRPEYHELYHEHMAAEYNIYFVQGWARQNNYIYYDYNNFCSRNTKEKPYEYFSYIIIKDSSEKRHIIQYYHWDEKKSHIVLTDLNDEFNKLSKKLNDEIKKRLELNRQKQLSQTLISTSEKLVNNNKKISADIDNVNICEYDQERNKIIEEELKRVSDYQNMLKRLIR